MSQLQFGEIIVDSAVRQVRRGDHVLPVSGKAFDLLLYMVENPNRPLLKKELLEAVWPESFVEDANLSQNVFLIRKALGEAGAHSIQTLSGRGYQFTARVTAIAPSADKASARPPGAQAATQVFGATETRVVYEEETEERIGFWRSPAMLLLGSATILALAVAGWLGWRRWEDRVGGPPVQVVLAEPEGSTGDPVLDRTLSSVLRMELAQSPFVSVVPVSTVRRTMVQMMHKPDDPLTAPLALDLCERTASQAVLRGSVARAGQGYLLTEEATNCVDGAVLGIARERAARGDDLPAAVEKLGAAIRHDLGDSRRTLSRFNSPLLPAATGSLEALKDYSQASYLAQLGRFPEASELLKQAVGIAPQVASAYRDLSNFSGNALDPAAERQYLQKAYELREYSTEPVRLFITARYGEQITGDLYQSERDYRSWVDLYPRSGQAWSGMTAVERALGNHEQELAAAQHTRELAPNNAVVYAALAAAQISTGDFTAARATCELAIHRGYDVEMVRILLLELGHLTQDEQLIRSEEAWANEHPDSPALLANEATYAQDEGRMHDAEKFFDQMEAAFRRQGTPQAAARIRQGESVAYLELGEAELGRKWLHSVPADGSEFNTLLALAEAGDSATAMTLVRRRIKEHPQSTLCNQWDAPLIEGDLAMKAHKPQEALTAMEPSRALDGHDVDGVYLRGEAFMQANQFPQAEAEFRKILSHPGIDPAAYQLPLSQLQLARVLSRENNVPAATEAYNAFLRLWAKADKDQRLLKQAQLELSLLSKESKQSHSPAL